MSENVNITVSGQQYSVAKWMAITLAGACLALSVWLVWLHYFKPIERSGQVVEATQAKEVEKTPTIAAPVKGGAVQAFPDSTKRALNLPEAVVSNTKKKVVAASKVAASDRPHTVTTLIDTETGKAETYVRTDPLPAFALRSSGAIGIGAGIRRGEPTTQIYFRQDFLQVKAMVLTGTLTAERSMNTGKTDASAMLNAEYRF